MKINEDTVGDVIGLICGIAFVVFMGYGLFKCCLDRDDRLQFEYEYSIKHPAHYEITYLDNHKDTLQVWTNPYDGDKIKMYNDGGIFTDGKVILSYIPYKRYKENEYRRNIKLYNVLYYKKLKTR